MKAKFVTRTLTLLRDPGRWAAALVGLALMMSVSACEETAPHLKAGDALLPFALPGLSGETITAPADTQGRVVALRFWADWCPFCLEEMKAIEPVYQTYKDDGLIVLAVNVGQTRERATKFVSKLGISYTTLLDEESEVAQQYRVIGLPMTFFIDRDGVVQGKILGESAPGVFADQVKRLIDKPAKVALEAQ